MRSTPVERGTFSVRNLIVSVLLFGLFAEWLRPLVPLARYTEVNTLAPFLGAIGFYLLIDTTFIRGWISWPLKLAFTFGWIGYWYQPELFASGEWWTEALRIADGDLQTLAQGDWSVSAEMRTFLFLAGWSALVYAIQRIASERGHMMWFIASTIAYLVILQLWPGLDTGDGVLRTAAMGLLLLTVLNSTRWERQLDFRFAEGRRDGLARSLAGILCGAAVLLLGYSLSAGESRDVQPVSLSIDKWDEWVRTAASESRWNGAAEAAAALTGYSVSDARLGRPVTPDHSVAFEAVVDRPTYWRGGTKDVYTGRGWRSSGLSDRAEIFQAASPGEGMETTEAAVTVLNPELGGYVFTGGTVLQFLALQNGDGAALSDIHIRYNPDDDAYYVGTDGVKLGSYQMRMTVPVQSVERLTADRAAVPSDPAERYLQLPADLPERVRKLAEEIVSDVPDNAYMQAAAIEEFLRTNYTYTLNTEMPAAGVDFVDHFLFETGVGYCDHFSTAMVVLLRSIGIEARWVKGFAPGTPDPERPGTYAVRQSDAHSWVEVRFADAGWVPFEPTPSTFAEAAASGGAGALTQTAATPYAADADTPQHALAAALDAWRGIAEERLRALPQQAADAWNAAMRRPPHEWLMPLYAWLAAAAAAFALALYFALLAARAIRRLRADAAEPPLLAAAGKRVTPQRRRLDRLWRRMYRLYGGLERGETLREYAARLYAEKPEAREALIELVRYDESVRYGGQRGNRVSNRWFDEVWRNIAK